MCFKLCVFFVLVYDFDDVIHWKQIKHRKNTYSSKTLLMNILNSGRANPLPRSIYRSYKRIPQSKSVNITPRGPY